MKQIRFTAKRLFKVYSNITLYVWTSQAWNITVAQEELER
jgi:hypothetical protein